MIETNTLRHRMTTYLILMRFDKPVGIFLLLWPVLWGLWIASEGQPSLVVLAVFVCGVIVMRSAGCVINDYADRKYDGYVKRTQSRPMVTGKVSPREALVLFFVLSVVAFGLVLTMNRLTILLSFAGIFLAVTYPLMKRYTYLAQVYLGAAFGWSVPMVFAAQTGAVPDIAWLIFVVTVLWATAYDTIYAMVDRADDLKIGIKSTAILFGDADRMIIAVIQVLVLVVLVVIGIRLALGWYYYLGIVIAGGLAGYQQYLIKGYDEKRCFKAFLNNNWFGCAIFVGILLNYFAQQ